MTSPLGTPGVPSPVRRIPIEWIRPNPFQPRVHRDDEAARRADEALREDMRRHGFRGAVQVRRDPVDPDRAFQLVAGQRRLEAWRALGHHDVPAQVVEHDDREMRLAALSENLLREDLAPWDEAVVLQALRADGLGVRELARRLGRSVGWVQGRLRLLDLGSAALREVARTEPELLTALTLIALFAPADQEVLLRMVRAGDYDTTDLKTLLSVRKELLKRQDEAVTDTGTTVHEVRTPPAAPPEGQEAGPPPARWRVADDPRLLETVREARRAGLAELAREVTRALEAPPAAPGSADAPGAGTWDDVPEPTDDDRARAREVAVGLEARRPVQPSAPHEPDRDPCRAGPGWSAGELVRYLGGVAAALRRGVGQGVPPDLLSAEQRAAVRRYLDEIADILASS